MSVSPTKIQLLGWGGAWLVQRDLVCCLAQGGAQEVVGGGSNRSTAVSLK